MNITMVFISDEIKFYRKVTKINHSELGGTERLRLTEEYSVNEILNQIEEFANEFEEDQLKYSSRRWRKEDKDRKKTKMERMRNLL